MNRIAVVVTFVALFLVRARGQQENIIPLPAAGAQNSYVNMQVNVMAPPYNAKGDCITDDSPAFAAAQTYAAANGWLPLFLPRPPGACYKASFNWQGVTLIGATPNGVSEGNALVEIRGLPGKDVLHVNDPTNTSGWAWNRSWNIENISLQVDNSVAGNFLHRWPGRWFDDAAMTAGSATLTTVNGEITCADVGQAIQISGAGPRGTNLVTTIRSVSPCFVSVSGRSSWGSVILAAAASTSVAKAHAYVSVLGLPVTTNVGACAIAFDDYDGNPSNWRHTTGGNIANYGDIVNNIAIDSTSGMTNNVCGIYTQGGWGPYAIDVENFTFRQLVFGVVQGSSELNSWYQSSSNDYQKWSHGSIESVTSPWISYNGGENKYEDIELTTANGPVFLNLGNRWSDAFVNALISFTEHEFETGQGWRVNGQNIVFLNNNFGSAKSIIVTDAGTCISCNGIGSAFELDGAGNKFDFAQDISRTTITNGGLNNKLTGRHVSNPVNGLPLNYTLAGFPTKRFEITGLLGPDYITDGNIATPYNLDDLVFWPQDFNQNTGGAPWSTYVATDSDSPTGAHMTIHAGAAIYGWAQYGGSSPIIGKDIPAGKVTFSMLVKCDPGVTTFQLLVGTVGGGYGYNRFFSHNFSGCQTSYQPFSTAVDFTSYPGGRVMFGTNGSAFYAAWVAITPWKNSNIHVLNTDSAISTPVLCSQLSSCGGPNAPSGTFRSISDPSTTPTYWAPAKGTGTAGPTSAAVYCDGAAWRYH